MKTCSKCGQDLDETAFNKNTKTKDGLASICRACASQYYYNNKEHILARHTQWRIDNKEQMYAQNKKYAEEHKDELDAYYNFYRKTHKEQIHEYGKQYREKNKDKIKARHNDYYATNRERISDTRHLYYLRNKDRRKLCDRRYRETNMGKLSNAKHNAKRRSFGFNNINDKQFACEVWHHLHLEDDHNFCISIPDFIHKFVPHKNNDINQMMSINAIAIQYWLDDLW